MRKSIEAILSPLVDALNDRSRTVLELHFGLTGSPMSLVEIASPYGVTRERIRQILRKTLDQLGAEAKPQLLQALDVEYAELRDALILEHRGQYVRSARLGAGFGLPWIHLALTICGQPTEDWFTRCLSPIPSAAD